MLRLYDSDMYLVIQMKNGILFKFLYSFISLDLNFYICKIMKSDLVT